MLSDGDATFRLAAYGLCVDDRGRLLLARCSDGEPEPGAWTLPGGGVDRGEHPDDAVLRELEEETGLVGTRGSVAGIYSVTHERTPQRPRPPHHGVGIVYWITSWTGTARAEVDGTTDACEWFGRDDLSDVVLVDLARFGVGLVWPDLAP